MVSHIALRALGCSALFNLVLATTTAPTTTTAQDHDLGDFDWQAIKPSWKLKYSSCYNNDFQCARLLLPLDWLEEDNAKQKSQIVAVALIKLPAVVSPRDSAYGGAVIINPGGPGDSGVLHILRNGHYMRNMMDTEGERHFDMLSFDPRGMANSVPIADCFESEAVRGMYDWQEHGKPFHRNGQYSNSSLIMELAHAKALGMKCAQRKGEDGVVIQEFMSTASVARDMLQMVDEIDRLEKEEARTVANGDGAQKRLGAGQSVMKQEAEGEQDDGSLPRLQYYGTSYGTLLGNTFISMFPGRVKRMMLDGVVVAEDYVAGDWCPFLLDTTASIDYFYQTCFSAGSAKCPLAKSSDKSWHDIKARVTDLMTDLDAYPVPVVVDGIAPTVLSSLSVVNRMMDPIYGPLDLYPALAETLAAALEGNYTALISESGFTPDAGEGVCDRNAGDPAAYKWVALAGAAVRCGDAADLGDKDISFWREYKQRCISNSPEIGAVWSNLACAGWQIRPRYRFTGPFGAPEADDSNIAGKPSAPVLFLSSRHDPVTPLVSAYTAAKNHPGARVVVQESVGHCTLLSGPSECTRRIMRAYMHTGEMPEDGTSCQADCTPWEKCDQPIAKLPR